MRALALLGLALVACAPEEARPTTVRVEGGAVILDGDRPLRAIRLDLEWDETLAVATVEAGADAARMNLVRAQIDGTRARVLVADSRALRLPIRGELLRIEATGGGAVRIVDVEAAEDGARVVPVEVRPPAASGGAE